MPASSDALAERGAIDSAAAALAPYDFYRVHERGEVSPRARRRHPRRRPRPAVPPLPPPRPSLRVLLSHSTETFRRLARSVPSPGEYTVDVGSAHGDATALMRARRVDRVLGLDVAHRSSPRPFAPSTRASRSSDSTPSRTPRSSAQRLAGAVNVFVDVGGVRAAERSCDSSRRRRLRVAPTDPRRRQVRGARETRKVPGRGRTPRRGGRRATWVVARLAPGARARGGVRGVGRFRVGIPPPTKPPPYDDGDATWSRVLAVARRGRGSERAREVDVSRVARRRVRRARFATVRAVPSEVSRTSRGRPPERPNTARRCVDFIITPPTGACASLRRAVRPQSRKVSLVRRGGTQGVRVRGGSRGGGRVRRAPGTRTHRRARAQPRRRRGTRGDWRKPRVGFGPGRGTRGDWRKREPEERRNRSSSWGRLPGFRRRSSSWGRRCSPVPARRSFYVVGGRNRGQTVGVAERLNLSTLEWERAPRLNDPRGSHGLAAAGNVLYAVAGGGVRSNLHTAESLRPSGGDGGGAGAGTGSAGVPDDNLSWSPAGVVAEARHAVAACATGDWGVYVLGGWGNGDASTGAVDFLDLREDDPGPNAGAFSLRGGRGFAAAPGPARGVRSRRYASPANSTPPRVSPTGVCSSSAGARATNPAWVPWMPSRRTTRPATSGDSSAPLRGARLRRRRRRPPRLRPHVGGATGGGDDSHMSANRVEKKARKAGKAAEAEATARGGVAPGKPPRREKPRWRRFDATHPREREREAKSEVCGGTTRTRTRTNC